MVAASPTVSVIIVNWHSQRFVRQCLESLYAYNSADELEVIVVDNASFDGCGTMLAAEFAGVKFIQSAVNVGFAGANNLAAARASGEYILLLNPDTLLIENSMDVLLRELRALPGAGAVGCRLLNSDRSLQTSCVQAFPTILNQLIVSDYLMRLFPFWPLWGTAPLYARPPKTAKVEVISGACMLIPKSAFRAVGGFTESYFMYSEDLDLCFKLGKAGYPVYYVPTTSIVHFGGGSTGQAAGDFSTMMMQSSVNQFMRLNYGWGIASLHRVTTMTSAVIRLVVMAPLMLFGRTLVRHGSSSFRKWFVILKWSLGLTARPPARVPAPATPTQITATGRP